MVRLCHWDRLRLNARWTMTDTDVREYAAQAASTDTFGRVLCSARNHHFVVDGPVQNGCPGEALTPPELFLAGVATCGVELAQVIARELSLPLARASVRIHATLDRGRQPRPDVTLFNAVKLSFELDGLSEPEA